MFKKPIKVKSNTQVKGSERKTFKNLLLKTFSNLTEADLDHFLPKKEVLNNLKITTSDDTVVQVYTVQKRAMIFDVKGCIFPTVFFLWKFPTLVYSFTTHPQVVHFIISGADLMLPGVVTPPPQSKLSKYGNVSENAIVSINLSNNTAAIAVGVATQSSASMALANQKGRCVTIQHFHGDHLCTLEGMPNMPVPNFGPPEWLKLKIYEEDFPELGSNPMKASTSKETVKEEEIPADTKEESVVEALVDSPSDDEDMDALLYHCFLGAIKYSKISLPALVSNFYKLHMLPFLPENKTLDIKKTSFKKLKPFLEEMAAEGIITLKEVKKGVEAIASINQKHPRYAEFYISPDKRPSKESLEDDAQTTNVVELYVITQKVLPIFQSQGYKKYDLVQPAVVRECVTKYVKENDLQDKDNPRLINPVDVLASICQVTHPVNWEELMEKVYSLMNNCYQVKTATEEVVNKGRLPPICMSVSVRSGNKKVTLVDNLESYGVRLTEFAKECQHGVGASTSITPVPGKSSSQLLVQGNQVLFVYNLLTEKYKVPKKYIKGLENAPKKKK